ncbi:Hypothetical protein SMAX5B_006717 [Scophthalmus maximus]|uniref:Uncharacterized protein n=1 Tax=Scophthalmus maximus TaxID=52904 RepID=A0A2U9AVM0_SCOMX|nr:Hypothetical protein SMAX5B_006717 [Scophthalmus maximus]
MHKSHSRRQRDGERGNTGSCALPAATGVGSGISEKEPEPKFEHGKGRAARVNALIPRQARPCRMHFNCDSHPCAQGDAVEQKARIPPFGLLPVVRLVPVCVRICPRSLASSVQAARVDRGAAGTFLRLPPRMQQSDPLSPVLHGSRDVPWNVHKLYLTSERFN